MDQLAPILELIEKIFVVVGSFVYLVFAIVIVRQVATMSKIVYDKFNTILIAFSWVHFLFSCFLVFSALLLL